jgi:hypothetical protein
MRGTVRYGVVKTNEMVSEGRRIIGSTGKEISIDRPLLFRCISDEYRSMLTLDLMDQLVAMIIDE